MRKEPNKVLHWTGIPRCYIPASELWRQASQAPRVQPQEHSHPDRQSSV